MNENKGSKGGNRDSRLYRFYLKLKKKMNKKILEDELNKSKNPGKDITNLNIIKNNKGLFTSYVEVADIKNKGAANYVLKNKKEVNENKEKDNIDFNIKDDSIVNDSLKKNVDINIETEKLIDNENNFINKFDEKTITKNEVPNNIVNKFEEKPIIIDEIRNNNEKKIPNENTVDAVNVVYVEEKVNKIEDNISNNAKIEVGSLRNTNPVNPVINDKYKGGINKGDNENKDVNVISEKEIKEIIMEDNILNYLDTLLKDNQYKLNKLISEYKLIKEEADKLDTYDKSIDTSKEIEILIERINKIKVELELLESSINLDKSYKFDDNYIAHLVEEYRNNYNNSFDSMAVDEIKNKNEYKSLMQQLNYIDKISQELEIEVNYKIEELKNRDKEFDIFKLSLEENDKSFQDIESMIKNSDYILNELEDKVNNSKHIVEKVTYITKAVNNHLDALLLGYLAIKSNPLVPKTIKALALTQLVIGSIENIFGKTEKRFHKEVVIDDYEKELIEGLNSIDDIFTLIDGTMEKVVGLKREFEEKFKDYDLKEYRDVLAKLDDLSKNISERRDYLSKTKKEFSRQLEKNNVKIKELKYEPYKEEENEVQDAA